MVIEMKRVCCLYRVSTLGQVDKEVDDIPMQKTACHGFIDSQPDWELYMEFYEKGVSGFKVSAKNRDAILELQKMALNKEFDVLLVFMFDRIGRKEDETPYVVQWFVEKGIEVWSVKEGQQKFEHHIDKLLNYIYYWQASGESIKTSIRVKGTMAEEVKKGHFKGGVPPFGYRLVDKGRLNKRGRAVKDLEIDKREASIVVYIFDLYVNHGLGTQTIARRFESEGIMNRKGDNFVCATIKNMVTNEMYRGILKCGDTQAGPFEKLRIISDEVFFKAREIAKQRSAKYQEGRRIPRKVAEHCLLTGNIFCGHCGGRLITSTSEKKKKRKDGTVWKKRVWRYVCYNNMRHKSKCNGQSGYSSKRIDDAVSEAIRRLLASMKQVPKEEIVSQRMRTRLHSKNEEAAALRRQVTTKQHDLDVLKGEVVKSITGKSAFTPEVLSSLIDDAEQDIAETLKKLEFIDREIREGEVEERELLASHEKLLSYGEMFDACDRDQKRMLICELVDEIQVSRGYEINLKLSFSLEQYLSLSEEPILERDDCKVMRRSNEPVIDLESLEGLSIDEAAFKVMEDNPGIEWEEAMQLLEIKNGDSGESGQLLRSLCWAVGHAS